MVCCDHEWEVAEIVCFFNVRSLVNHPLQHVRVAGFNGAYDRRLSAPASRVKVAPLTQEELRNFTLAGFNCEQERRSFPSIVLLDVCPFVDETSDLSKVAKCDGKEQTA